MHTSENLINTIKYLHYDKQHRKFFEHAFTAAMSSPGIGKGKFKLGAILTDGRNILSAGFNQYKTHPNLDPHTEFPYLHAETHTLFKYGLDNCAGLSLYVLRWMKCGRVGLAKPCDVCMHFIEEAGIANLYYTTDDGWYEAIKL